MAKAMANAVEVVARPERRPKNPAETWPITLRTLQVGTHEHLLRAAGARNITVGEYIARLVAVTEIAQDTIARFEAGDNTDADVLLQGLRFRVCELGMERVTA